VVEIPSDGGEEGHLDMVKLEWELQRHSAARDAFGRKKQLLGSFSACSNVTGLLTDTRAVARLLHKYGAYACFDFAARSASDSKS
jgi:selenocysteine lyase/cysteine desulfurase